MLHEKDGNRYVSVCVNVVESGKVWLFFSSNDLTTIKVVLRSLSVPGEIQ